MPFLHLPHLLRPAHSPVIIPQKVKNTVHDKPRNLLRNADTKGSCLLTCSVKVHVNLSFQHLPAFQREGDYIRYVIMVQVFPVDCPAPSRINEYNRNPSLPRSHHSTDVRFYGASPHTVAMMRVDNVNIRHQRDLAARLPAFPRLRSPACAFGATGEVSRIVSVSERAMPDSITSGPSCVKSPDSNARSTLA